MQDEKQKKIQGDSFFYAKIKKPLFWRGNTDTDLCVLAYRINFFFLFLNFLIVKIRSAEPENNNATNKKEPLQAKLIFIGRPHVRCCLDMSPFDIPSGASGFVS